MTKRRAEQIINKALIADKMLREINEDIEICGLRNAQLHIFRLKDLKELAEALKEPVEYEGDYVLFYHRGLRVFYLGMQGGQACY